MSMFKILVYDGSFEGLMCCIFTLYEQKIPVFRLARIGEPLGELFAQTIQVKSNKAQAQRVWSGIKRKSSNISLERIELAYLSEIRGEDHTIIRYVQYLIDSKKNIEENLSHPVVQRLNDVVKMLHREKQVVKEKIRFQTLVNDIKYNIIEPNYNVLPLLKEYLLQKYAKQKWIVYDIRRNKGLFYNLQEIKDIQLDLPTKNPEENMFQEEEKVLQKLIELLLQ
ncbi:MAG: TIGR03915 family putative DNA repair protein [Sphingobacteriales bacterium]|nr:TIGR03915 family putative DNA repair protein [Sphingobacteriales bacterium]